MRLFKNKTEEDVVITIGAISRVIPAEDEYDLSLDFSNESLHESTTLIELLGLGTDKYVLNDGNGDLSVTDAINLVCGIYATRISLVGDSDAGIPRIAIQAAAIPEASVEFVLGVTSEMSPSQVIETVSDPIPEDKTLHLLFARASCCPSSDVNNVKNSMLVEIIYREVWEEETYDHLFGKSYLDIECSADFPASSRCWDGTPMIGDGETTVLVIRRSIFGNVEDQDTLVAVRGYIV
jgi:hypothetical protein